MAFSIRSNIGSLNAQLNVTNSQNMLQDSFAKLSSGLRITKAGDDAAGLGIANNLGAQIRSLLQANRNSQDAQSLIQTAESALNQTTEILTRMRELAMQAASDGVGLTERGYIEGEKDALVEEIDRISDTAEFNGAKLLDGSVTEFRFQVGIRATANDYIEVTTQEVSATTLGVSALDFTDRDQAAAALATIDTAIQNVSGYRADFGAAGNRVASVSQTIMTSTEAISAARSRILDVDVAQETSTLARTQVLVQAGVSVLAQANQSPQVALKLLG